MSLRCTTRSDGGKKEKSAPCVAARGHVSRKHDLIDTYPYRYQDAA
jgi:hypothetical protein